MMAAIVPSRSTVSCGHAQTFSMAAWRLIFAGSGGSAAISCEARIANVDVMSRLRNDRVGQERDVAQTSCLWGQQASCLPPSRTHCPAWPQQRRQDAWYPFSLCRGSWSVAPAFGVQGLDPALAFDA